MKTKINQRKIDGQETVGVLPWQLTSVSSARKKFLVQTSRKDLSVLTAEARFSTSRELRLKK